MKRRSLLKSLGLFLGIGPFVKAEPVEQTHDKEIVFCENALEFLKCRNDIVYFVEKYCAKSFVLAEKQKEILKQCVTEQRLCVVASRQCGKTFIQKSYILWKSLFFNDQNILIVVGKEHTGELILRDLENTYQNIPNSLKPDARSRNRRMIGFENGSTVITSSRTLAKYITSQKWTEVMCDEPAFYDQDILIGVVENALKPNTEIKLSLFGTVNEKNGFFYECSQSPLIFTQNRLSWRDVHGSEWGKTMKSLLTEGQWNHEFENLGLTC